MSKTNTDIKLFNLWSFKEIEIPDWTLATYINLKPIIIPQSCGRHEHRRFWKTTRVSIIERVINRLLAPGFIASKVKGRKSSYNSGKKNKLIKMIQNAFILIELKTEKNPIQVIVDAICNSAPREEVTRIAMGGISYASAVDISPQRRVDLSIKYLVQAISASSHSNERDFAANLARELILAADNSQESRAVKKKDEIERIATSAR